MLVKKKNLVKAILDWHRLVGIELSPEVLEKHTYRKYLHLVEDLTSRFSRHQLAPEEIAHMQLGAPLSLFANKTIPHDIIRKNELTSLLESFDSLRLSQIAEFILHYPDNLEKKEDMEPVFSLPKGWETHPVRLRPFSKCVPIRNTSPSGVVYDQYSQVFKKMESHGLGGLDLMVAAHNTAWSEGGLLHRAERQTDRTEETTVVVYSPASFNFQLSTGGNTLVTNILNRRISITELVVGVSGGWAIQSRKQDIDRVE